MRRVLVSPLIAVLCFCNTGSARDIDIGANDSNNSVVLEGEEVERSHDRGHDGSRNRMEAEPKSPCKYNGLLLICDLPDKAPAGTVFTPGLARQAVANIPMPGLTLRVQPDGDTLVNVRTNFWVRPEPVETSVDLLGHTIEVEATPSSFTWIHGDGTSQTTTYPGHPYPRLDITHRYNQPAKVGASVVTTYEVRYSIDGGGWTDLGEPLVAHGTSTPIDVHEAAPVLAR